jgi:hypothetical protein
VEFSQRRPLEPQPRAAFIKKALCVVVSVRFQVLADLTSKGHGGRPWSARSEPGQPRLPSINFHEVAVPPVGCEVSIWPISGPGPATRVNLTVA